MFHTSHKRRVLEDAQIGEKGLTLQLPSAIVMFSGQACCYVLEQHMVTASSLLRLARISKSYSAKVLSEVDFDLRAGEVHALVGENGAGKSTLARIMAGLTKPDSGQMLLAG